MAPEALLPCFGPFGRSKLIKKDISGEIIITKDGQQILEYCNHSHTSSSFIAFQGVVRAACIDFGTRHGDGSSSTMLLLEFLLKHIICRYPDVMISSPSSQQSSYMVYPGSNRSFGKSYVKRISLLQSFNHIRKVFHSNAPRIKSYFNECNVFQRITDYKLFAKGIWTNLLVSAANPNIAKRIISLMLCWFDGEHLPRSEALRSASIRQFQHTCSYILDNIDVFIISTKIGSFHDSYVLGKRKYMLEGRLQEQSSLFLPTSDEVQIGEDNSKNFRFVCIKHIDFSLHTPISVEMKDSQDMKSVFTMCKSHLSNAFRNLSNCGVQVIFTSDNVYGDVLFLLKSFRLRVVDRVPLNHLIGLTAFASIQAIDDCDSLSISKDETLESIMRNCVGSFQYADKIVYSPDESFIIMHSVNRGSTYYGRESDSKVGNLSQMILHGSGSESIAYLYKRLIKRCLKLVTTAKIFTADVISDDCNDGSVDYVYVAKGMGTVEIAWCQLLRKIIAALACTPKNDPHSVHLASQVEILSIEYVLAHQLKQCLSKGNPSFHTNDTTSVLEAIYSAYESMLRLMIGNAFGSKNSPSHSRKVGHILNKLKAKQHEPNRQQQRERQTADDVDDQEMELGSILRRVNLFNSSCEQILQSQDPICTSYVLETLTASRMDMVLELAQLFLRIDHHHVISSIGTGTSTRSGTSASTPIVNGSSNGSNSGSSGAYTYT